MPMSDKQIYLDYNATTPTDQRVVDAMLPYFTENFGNSSSVQHRYGKESAQAIHQSKSTIKNLINRVNSGDIIFTSGATESINLALKGVLFSPNTHGKHIITSQTEHKAVLDTCTAMQKNGIQVTYLPVDKNGIVNIEDLEGQINPTTVLVSIIWANNETGVIQNMKAISQIAKKYDIIFMSDVTQAIGKTEVNLDKVDIDLLAFSGHKIYGPKGVGGLFLSERALQLGLVPQITGGGQQRDLRSGTLNTPGIVGLARAFEILQEDMDSEIRRVTELRDKFEKGLKNISPLISINGEDVPRISNTSNVAFPGISSEKIILNCRELAISSGSACNSSALSPSHVLKAMNLDESILNSSIRFSLGRFTTKEEIDYTLQKVAELYS